MKATIGTDHPGAFVHEFGAVIKPVRARFLHFYIDGQEIFAKQVVIPARPYLRPAVDENVAKVGVSMGVVFAAMFRKYAL
jgi:phage gpG-like protein